MEGEISRFLCNFFQLGTMFFLCVYVLRDGLRMPVRKIVAYGAVFTAAFCLAIAVIYANFNLGYFSLFGIVIYIIGSALLLFRAINHEKGKITFVLLVVISYLYFTMNLGNILGVLWELPIFDFSYLVTLLYLSCVLAPLYPFARFMNWLWARIRSLRETAWYRLCLVPLAFIVMGAMHWEFFLAGMISGAAFPVFQAVIITSAFVVYWQIADGLSKAADAAQLAERLRNVDNQLLLQAELLNESTSHEMEMKQIRHDMRHHFATLEAMLSENDNERARTYLREYIGKVEDSAVPSVCKNAVADAVCRRYMLLAEKQSIRTDVAADIPVEPGVSDSDLAVLLSNLWENALEACVRQSAGERYIKMRAKTTGNSLMISMTNSFDGVIRSHTDKDGEPVLLSLKRGGTQEGFGLASIRTIVGRYKGLDEATYDTDSFHVKVLLYTEGSLKTGSTV